MHPNVIALRFQAAAALLVLAFAALPAQGHGVADALISPSQLTSTIPIEAFSGVVQTVVVDNRVSQVTSRYVGLTLDDGRSVALTGAGVELLASGARVQVTGQRSGNALVVSSYNVVAGAGGKAALKALVTDQAQGTLALLHADNFDQGRSAYSLIVRGSDDVTTRLALAVTPDELRIGMSVVAQGTLAADGKSLDVSSITILALPQAQPTDPLAAPITNKVLVILVQFPASGVPAFTQAAVDQVMRTDSTSVANYYQEVSYGQQLLNVTVTPWLLSASAAPASCDYTALANAGDAAATAAGYTPSNYQNRFYVFPFRGDCGWAGLAYIGYGQAWSNGYNQLSVYAHELGHNFNLRHAASLYCAGQAMHFNAAQKSILNWIPAASVKTHGTGSVTYTLSPLESPGGTTYAVKIPAAANRIYWLEYRQPIGFDSGLSAYPNNGAQVRVGSPFESLCSGCGDNAP